MATELIVSRFIHILALSILFGGALFPFYGVAPAIDDPFFRLPWLQRLLLVAAVLTLIAGFCWFWFAVGGVGNAADLSAAIRNAKFGWAWPIRLLLATGLVLVLLGKRVTPRRIQIVIAGSLVLLTSIALTGHAGNDESPAALQHRILDAVHLIASGIWVGALFVLARLVMMSTRRLRDYDLNTLHHALAEFSGIGSIAVAALVLSGILNPGFSSSLRTAYGQLLLTKLAMFAAMLALAAANRFWLTPRLSRTLGSARGLEPAMRALRFSILSETALGVLVLLVVGWLGTLSPAAPR